MPGSSRRTEWLLDLAARCVVGLIAAAVCAFATVAVQMRLLLAESIGWKWMAIGAGVGFVLGFFAGNVFFHSVGESIGRR
jgi:hypothetical protein